MRVRNERPLVLAVIRRIAEAEGVPPERLEYSLYEFIDPDVLDALAENTTGEWTLEFTVDSHAVSVDSDGRVTVDGATVEVEY